MMNDDAVSETDNQRSRVTNPYLKKRIVAKKISNDSSLSNGVTSTNSAASPPAQHEKKTKLEESAESAAAISAHTTVHEKQTFGEKEPAMERLPSRNVSFASAEILTVSELRKYASLYRDYSVRITGVVIHRHVACDSHVCLVLKDPSVQPSNKVAPRSVLKTPAATSRGGLKPRLSGSTSRLVTARKRPFSSLKKPPTKAPVDPIESIVSSLMEKPTTVLLYAASQQVPVNDAAIGDLVMIIGEVRSSPVPSSALEAILERCKEKTISTQFYLHTRVLRNVNGTDMRLHDESLRMRRRHLQQTTLLREEADDESLLHAGWGPPPYAVNNSNGNTANEVNV